MKINFGIIQREEVLPGFKQKKVLKNNMIVRLINVDVGFVENGWCMKEHSGYIIKGNLIVELENNELIFEPGQALLLFKNIKHRVNMLKATSGVEFILFEKIENDNS